MTINNKYKDFRAQKKRRLLTAVVVIKNKRKRLVKPE